MQAISTAATRYGFDLGPAFSEGSLGKDKSSCASACQLEAVSPLEFPCMYSYQGMYFILFQVRLSHR